MYLSRLTLDPRRRETRDWLGDCHRLHRAIMSAFPDAESDAARAELGVLFRVENDLSGGLVRVAVQSRVEPRWAFETPHVRVEGPKRVDVLVARIVPGAVFRFRLRANPTRRIHPRATQERDLRELDRAGQWRDREAIPEAERTGVARRDYVEPSKCVVAREDGRQIGKRVELRREEDRLAWLARRGREYDGFALTTVRLDPAGREVDAARADPAGRLLSRSRQLTFGTALFEGALVVTDAERFRAAFEGGIGPGKAFGCGLLSLAPAGAAP
jgi:CRISPR system Cascade subunit CasE